MKMKCIFIFNPINLIEQQRRIKVAVPKWKYTSFYTLLNANLELIISKDFRFFKYEQKTIL